MAERVVAFVLRQLSTWLRPQYVQLTGLRQGLQFINDELGTMSAFLRDVEAEHEQNNEIQEWIKQLRDAAYDAEDVIDEYTLVFSCRRVGGFYGRVQHIYIATKTLSARYRISRKIYNIKYRVKDISAKHKKYKLNYVIQGTGSSTTAEDDSVQHIRQRALLEEADLVGILLPKNELVFACPHDECSSTDAAQVSGWNMANDIENRSRNLSRVHSTNESESSNSIEIDSPLSVQKMDLSVHWGLGPAVYAKDDSSSSSSVRSYPVIHQGKSSFSGKPQFGADGDEDSDLVEINAFIQILRG